MRLTAGDLAAEFVPSASMVCASLTRDGEELLGQRAGLDAWIETGKTFGIPLLHPWANRAHLDLPDDAPQVRRDDNGVPIHGLLHGRAEFTVGDDGTARFDFGAHPELLGLFPHPHVVEVTPALDPGGLTITTTIRNTGVLPVPISFGWHPYVHRDDTFEAGIDEPSDLRSITSGGVTIELGEGYTHAHLFTTDDLLSLEPMTAPVDALHTGTDLRSVRGGASFSATFRLSVTG